MSHEAIYALQPWVFTASQQRPGDSHSTADCLLGLCQLCNGPSQPQVHVLHSVAVCGCPSRADCSRSSKQQAALVIEQEAAKSPALHLHTGQGCLGHFNARACLQLVASLHSQNIRDTAHSAVPATIARS